MALSLPGPQKPPGGSPKRVRLPKVTKGVKKPGPGGRRRPGIATGRAKLGIEWTPKPPAAAGPSPVASPVTTRGVLPDPFAGNPYRGLPGYAQRDLRQIDSDQQFHQDYVNKTVAPWLSAALTGLAGFNTAAQSNLNAQIQGNQAAAAITPTMTSATGPGGIVAGDNSYLTGAGQQYAAGMGKSAQDLAAYQTAMAKMQPTTLSQGYIAALADYAKGLPYIYSERRAQYIDKLNTYLAQVQSEQMKAQAEADKQAETVRHHKVQEATAALNANNGLIQGLARLGLDASKFGADQAGRSVAASTPAPKGYVAVPDGKGGVTYKTDPTYVKPGGGSGGGVSPSVANKPLTKSQISSMNGRWKGDKNSPPKLGAGWKQPVWDPGTKRWYAKRAAGGGSATTPKPLVKAMDQQSLINKLVSAYQPPTSGTGTSIAVRHAGDPKGAATELVRWILDRKNSFTKNGRTVDAAKLRAVLKAAVGGADPTKAHGGVQWWVLDILQRGYIDANGNWK
jgi:hypothetical protein